MRHRFVDARSLYHSLTGSGLCALEGFYVWNVLGPHGAGKPRPTTVLFEKKITRSQVIEKMVRPERFELPTFWFVARRSIQLS